MDIVIASARPSVRTHGYRTYKTMVGLGVGGARGQKLFFPYMVMWNIKLKRMVNRTGYK